MQQITLEVDENNVAVATFIKPKGKQWRMEFGIIFHEGPVMFPSVFASSFAPRRG